MHISGLYYWVFRVLTFYSLWCSVLGSVVALRIKFRQTNFARNTSTTFSGVEN